MLDDTGYGVAQWRWIAGPKAFTRRIVPSLRIDPGQIDFVSGLSSQYEEKSSLRAAVALTERMDCIQFG